MACERLPHGRCLSKNDEKWKGTGSKNTGSSLGIFVQNSVQKCCLQPQEVPPPPTPTRAMQSCRDNGQVSGEGYQDSFPSCHPDTTPSCISPCNPYLVSFC